MLKSSKIRGTVLLDDGSSGQGGAALGTVDGDSVDGLVVVHFRFRAGVCEEETDGDRDR